MRIVLPPCLLTTGNNRRKQPRRGTGEGESTTAYVAGMNGTSGVLAGKFNIRVVFNCGRTLHSMLTNVKDTLPLGKQSVYRIPCSCGQVYIRETKRRLETILKEHQDACERGMIEKLAVAKHAWGNHHLIY